jgi:hypothetical protein
MRVGQVLKIIHQVLTHIIHTHFPTHHTHLTTLSLSSGKDDSLSHLALAATTKIQQTQGEKKKRHFSLVKWSGNIGKLHSQKDGICIDRSTRHSVEVYTIHKITIIDDMARLGWFWAAFQLTQCNPSTQPWATPESTGTLRLWNVVPGPERSLRCLRRVWVHARTSLHYPCNTPGVKHY